LFGLFDDPPAAPGLVEPRSHPGVTAPPVPFVAEEIHRRLSPAGISLLGSLIGPVGDDDALVGSLRAWQQQQRIQPLGSLDTATEHSLVSALVGRGDVQGAVDLVVDLYDLRMGSMGYLAKVDKDFNAKYRGGKVAVLECGNSSGDTHLSPDDMATMGQHGERPVELIRGGHLLHLAPGTPPGPGSSPEAYADFVRTILHEGQHMQFCQPGDNEEHIRQHLPGAEFDAYAVEVFPYSNVPPITSDQLRNSITRALDFYDQMSQEDRTPQRALVWHRLHGALILDMATEWHVPTDGRPPRDGTWWDPDRGGAALGMVRMYDAMPAGARSPAVDAVMPYVRALASGDRAQAPR